MTSLTPYLPLDTVAWPLDKNDIQDLRWVVFFFLNDSEVWLAQG